MDPEENTVLIREIIDLLNSDSALSVMANDYNVVWCVEELLSMYHDVDEKLKEIHDATRF